MLLQDYDYDYIGLIGKKQLCADINPTLHIMVVNVVILMILVAGSIL